jgi:bifunctional DNA-binding transcriptional regulator/antitoxin component of YhaV-PrlF toxin-antitoxin module
MRITVSDNGALVIPGDSIPGFSAKPGDQFELAPDPDGTALILTRVTDKDSLYGILGTGGSTDEIMDELRGPVDTGGD